MPTLGPWELIIVLVIVVVIFGAGKIADIGGALGKSVREFRGAVKDPEAEAAEQAEQAKVVAGAPVTPAMVAPAAPTENKCPSCATVNPPAQVFCGQCGTRLTRAA